MDVKDIDDVLEDNNMGGVSDVSVKKSKTTKGSGKSSEKKPSKKGSTPTAIKPGLIPIQSTGNIAVYSVPSVNKCLGKFSGRIYLNKIVSDSFVSAIFGMPGYGVLDGFVKSSDLPKSILIELSNIRDQ